MPEQIRTNAYPLRMLLSAYMNAALSIFILLGRFMPKTLIRLYCALSSEEPSDDDLIVRLLKRLP